MPEGNAGRSLRAGDQPWAGLRTQGRSIGPPQDQYFALRVRQLQSDELIG